MKRTELHILAAIQILFLLSGCLRPERTAGGTTDTGNAISASVAGVAVDSAGQPIAGANVRLRPADYLSPLPGLLKQAITDFDGETDSLGHFAIGDIDSGLYRLELAEGGEGNSATVIDLDLRAPGALPGFTADLGRARLLPMGILTGKVARRSPEHRAYVQVFGMERLTVADPASGQFALRLPAGRFTLRITEPACGAACTRDIQGLAVAGSASDLGTVDMGSDGPYAVWSHSALICFPEDSAALDGYPMLVRLEGSFFPFAQAGGDGSDIRFASLDLEPLAFEIETWDSAAGAAAIWVRMDAAQGNAIRMHWGRADAQASGNGSSVFAADRFAGVWHLGESGGNHGDASANGNRGYATSLAGYAVSGVAGRAHDFGSASGGIRVPDAPSLRFGAGDFAITAWVRDGGGAGTRQVLCKRSPDSDYELQVTAEGRPKGYAGRNPGIPSVTGATGLVPGAWHLLGLVRRGDSLSVFRDGEPEGSLLAKGMGDADNAADVFLGRDPGKALGEAWVGDMDEVRILRGAPSAGWMRRDFATQAPDARVPVWSDFR